MTSLESFTKMCLEENCYTPDVAALTQKYTHVPVFVFGCEKLHYSEDWFLRGITRIGFGLTEAAHFVMKKTKEAEPVVFHRPLDPACAKIMGELYVVPMHVLFKLDQYHQNGQFTRRRWQEIKYIKTSGKSNLSVRYITEAFVYCADQSKEFWINKQKNNEFINLPVLHRADTHEPYYLFTDSDDKPNRRRSVM